MARHNRITPRFLVRKGPRFYWQPPKYLRALGLETERLPDDAPASWERAEILNARADQIRSGKRRSTPGNILAGPPSAPRGTVAWLIQRWAGDITDGNTPGCSPEWRRLAPRTRNDYRRYLQALNTVFGSHRITSLTPRVVHAYKAKLADPETGLLSRGGRYKLQVLQALLAYAVRIGELGANPATRMRLNAAPPRRAYWTEDAVGRFLEAGPPPSLRLALMLGLWTGQRQADILNLRWSDISDGWITIEQRKTGKRVAIPISQELSAELARVDRQAVQVIVAEATKRPYRPDHFRHEWREGTLRAGLDGLQFLDLRRSAVVRLAEAGAEVGEIAAWTGHAINETTAILNTYFVPTRKAAEAALVKLEAARTKREQTDG